MITAVRLSNNNLQIITGNEGKSVSAKRVYETTLLNDCIINGVVTNEGDFKKQISEFWQANDLPKKDVFLIINSSQMVLKSASVPTEKDNKMLEMITREFPETEKSEPQLFDYKVLAEKKDTKFSDVLAVMTPVSLVESYVNIFNDIGISVNSVMPIQLSALEAIYSLSSMKDETAIIQLFDSNMLISLLWSKGAYAYAQRTRLFSDYDSDDFQTEVSGNISSMLQFYSTLRKSDNLKNVYVCGLNGKPLEKCNDAINQLGLSSAHFNSDDKEEAEGNMLNNMIDSLGPFIKSQHSVNLFDRYKKQTGSSSEKQQFVKKYMPLIITVGVVVVALIGLLLTNIIMKASLEKQKAYLNDATNISQAAEAKKITDENTSLQTTINALNSAIAAQQSYPKLNASVINSINQAGSGVVSMNISSYYAKNGQLTLTALTGSVEQINSYIDRLKATNLFDNIEYSGYSYNQSTGTYTINVVCYLNSEAGK